MERQLHGDWIWTGEALPAQNQFVCFRKAFTLSSVPESAHLAISAERFYQLWINGRWVGEGPAVGHPSQKCYDAYEIAPYLCVGQNALAVVVQFDGDVDTGDGAHTRWYVAPTRGGFWCQLTGRAGAEPFLIASDGAWAARPALGWRSNVRYLNDLYFQEIYTCGRDPVDWMLPTFDDRAWPRASVLGDCRGGGRDGQALPWTNLVARDFPHLTRTRHLPVRAEPGEVVERMRTGDVPQNENRPYPDIGLRLTLEPLIALHKARVTGADHLVCAEPGGVCLLENSDPYESVETFDGLHDATVTLDFGRLLNACLVLEVEGPGGAALDIGYGPDLLDGKVSPYRSWRTSWADRVILADGVQRWRSFFWRQFRYVQITVRDTHGPVYLRRATAEALTHTWETTAAFRCSDPELAAIWSAAERTAELCTLDRFMDNASRECRGYSNPPLLSAMVALHGDAPFCRRHLHQLSLAQLPNGIFMDCCPGKGSYQQIATEAGFVHVQAIWDHYARFGQVSWLEEHWLPVQRWLSVWEPLVNERGLLTVEGTRAALRPGFVWPWLDDAPLDRRGEQLPLNAMYLLNLRAGAAMGRCLGELAQAAAYQGRADRISGALQSEFWDEDRGLFVDAVVEGRRGAIASEHSQGLMLLLGLATPDRAQRMVTAWSRTPEGLAEAEIGFMYYILEGLARYGRVAFGVSLLRRLCRHLRAGRETVGELWTLKGGRTGGPWHTVESRAVAQGVGAWPVAFILEHLIGLQPRWGTRGVLRLAPQPLVEQAQVSWCGIEVTIEKHDRDWSLAAHFPRPMPLELVLPGSCAVVSLRVDDQPAAYRPVMRLEPRESLAVEARWVPPPPS